MEINLSPELQAKLDRMALQQDATLNRWCMKQSSVWWDTTNGLSAKSKKGLAQVESGQVLEHEEVAARMEKLITQNSAGSDATSLDLGSGRGLRKHRELSLRKNTRKCRRA